MAPAPSSFPLHRRRALQLGLSACMLAPVAVRAHAASPAAGKLGTSRCFEFIPGRDPASIPAPPAAKAEERFMDVPEGRLKYLDTGGNGEPVILLHAATGTGRSWDYQLPALTAAGFRVIAPWRRGTLESSTGAAPNNTLETRDLAALADGLGLDRFHLLGSAAGAFVAIRFAVANETRLLSLTLANSLLGLNQPEFVRLLDVVLPQGFQALPSEFKELSGSYRIANPQGVQRWLDIEQGSLAAQLGQRPDAAAVMRAGVRGSGGPSYADLQALNLKVLLVYGDADLYAPPALARILAKQFRNVQLTIIGESGHASHWEQPDPFNSVVTAFLAGTHQKQHVGRQAPGF